ncbi:MAG: nucleotidyl transferase AbiEii/AbiGii toxin family protein [Rikenellaceae bacterium]
MLTLISKFKEFGIADYCSAVPQDDGEGDTTYPEPRQVHIIYESLFDRKDSYIKQEVLLEISSRSLIEPTGNRQVNSLVATTFPQISCDVATCDIITALPEKTFLEKSFLLHELFTVGTATVANRRSRHLYDLEKMMDKPFARAAIKNNELWESIRHHREVFTPISGVDYGCEIRDDICLTPPADIIEQWRDDYETMVGSMIYGDKLSFDELLERISVLEKLYIR